jgi:hypothetical protein
VALVGATTAALKVDSVTARAAAAMASVGPGAHHNCMDRVLMFPFIASQLEAWRGVHGWSQLCKRSFRASVCPRDVVLLT